MGTGTGVATLLWLHIQRYDKAKTNNGRSTLGIAQPNLDTSVVRLGDDWALVVMATFMAYLGLLPLHLLAWPYADKVLHMALFGALAFWLNLWLPDWQLQMGRIKAPVAVVLPFILAAVEEGLQSFSSLRTFDLGDLASDLLGLLLFYALSRWVMARMSSQGVLGSPLAQQDKIAR
jgi:polysaccharide biosynthesis protein VpsQ